MSDNKVLFVPIWSGSKGIPHKNIKEFCGKPLFYWGIRVALDSGIFDQIIVSTESSEYRRIVKSYFSDESVCVDSRPQELALDSTSTEDVMCEFFGRECYSAKTISVLYQVSSPIVRTEDFVEIVARLSDCQYDSALSVVEFKRFLWSAKNEPLNYCPRQRPRRQEMEPYFCENGALYACRVDGLLEKRSRLYGRIGTVVMPDSSFYEIDEASDWVIAEKLFELEK